MADLLKWVESVTADQLPEAPFRLNHCLTVMDTAAWLGLIQREARDQKHPRVKSGALHAEIQRLHDITDGAMTWD